MCIRDSNRIKQVAEDKNGFLWIKTVPELFSCYDLQKACFVDFTGTGDDGESYSEIYMSSNGDVWLWHRASGVRQIVCKENRTMTSVKFRAESGRLPDDRIKFINEDSSGRIWIGTMHGLASVYKGKVEIVDRELNFSSSFPHGGDCLLYTSTYSPNQGLVRLNEEAGSVPKTLRNVFMKDVTDEYGTTINPAFPVLSGERERREKYAYLAVFDNEKWIPICFSEIKESKRVTFDKVEKGAVYPVSYTHLDVYKRQIWTSWLWCSSR